MVFLQTFGTFVHAIFEKSQTNPQFHAFLQFYSIAEHRGVEFETLFTEIKTKVEAIEASLAEEFQPIAIKKEH